MKKLSTILLTSLAILLTMPSFLPILPAHAVSPPAGKYFDYAVTIMMENTGINSTYNFCSSGTNCYVMGNINAPYMNGFVSSHAFAEGYSGADHPSEGNYVVLAGGGIFITCKDCTSNRFLLPESNLVDLLNPAGITWQAYAESAGNSGTCSFDPTRHNEHFGFLDFANNNNTTRCANFLTTTAPGDTEVITALNSTSPPHYLWLTPTDNDNCHDVALSTSSACDTYLANLVPKILNSKTFLNSRAALFITFDEGGRNYPNDFVYTVMAGPSVKPGYISSTQYSHYSYLHTIEDNWGLACLNTATLGDCNAPIMNEFFANYGTGNFGPCTPLSTGWNCDNVRGARGTVATHANGVAITNLFAAPFGFNNFTYSTTQKGSFPFSGSGNCGSASAPVPGVLPTGLKLVSSTFNMTKFVPAGTNYRYHIYIALYYWLPNGPVTAGGHTHQCLDTQSRVENINGQFSSVGTTQPYDAGDSFGWDNVTQGTITANNQYTLYSNVAKQCAGDLAIWGVPSSTPCQLAGVEIGIEGFEFQELDVLWKNFDFNPLIVITGPVGWIFTTNNTPTVAQLTIQSVFSTSVNLSWFIYSKPSGGSISCNLSTTSVTTNATATLTCTITVTGAYVIGVNGVSPLTPSTSGTLVYFTTSGGGGGCGRPQHGDPPC